ncbi:MAG: ATP-binding protein [Actinomycetota bacterium]
MPVEKIRVRVAADQFEKLARPTRPVRAVEELIWNSLDAEADHVSVVLGLGDLGAVETVNVIDNGHGMTYSDAKEGFSDLGGSWKKGRKRTRNGKRSLHGKDGEGRFRAFALGRRATWSSFADDGLGDLLHVTVTGSVSDEEFAIEEPKPAPAGSAPGTEVTTTLAREHVGQLLRDDAPTKLVTRLAAFLTAYPHVRVVYNAEPLSVDSILVDKFETELSVELDGRFGAPALTVMVWDQRVPPSIILCDEDGVAMHETTDDLPKTDATSYTAYVRWEGFGDHEQQLLLGELDHQTIGPILRAARGVIESYLDRRENAERAALIDEWRAARIYPYEDEPATAIQRAERQVFDAVAVTAAQSMKGDSRSTKLSLRLLKEALETDPGSLHAVLEDVLDLTPDQLDDFALLLKRTPLASVISTTKLVTDRLEFLDELEAILFDEESRNRLLERTQLHKILEDRVWTFGEEFSLAVSDRGLTKVLEKHRKLLGEDAPADGPVKDADGHTRIVDLFLSKAVADPEGRRHLVVELKRPKVKLTMEECAQVLNYADAIAKDERFSDESVRWDFVLLGNQMDDSVKATAHQSGRERGLFAAPDGAHYRVWVKLWSEVLEDNRQRLHFYRDHLSYEPAEDIGFEDTIEKYLPGEVGERPVAS